MKLIVLLSLLTAPIASGQMHRAEQDREIRYWLLDPATHEFKISHDFNVTRVGQKSVHSFVRKGSTVVQSQIFDLDTGEELKTYNVTGKDTNALGYYPSAVPDDEVVVQGDLPHPIEAGQSVRIRVVETYMDPAYAAKNGELVWDRTLGRPRNEVTLPDGWMLTQVSVPAIISLDPQGRITCRFTNPRNDEIHVVLKARRRPGRHALHPLTRGVFLAGTRNAARDTNSNKNQGADTDPMTRHVQIVSPQR